MIGHLNANSIADAIQETFYILLLSETKYDESFPDKQFCLNNFKIFRKDRNRYEEGIMFYVNKNLPCKSLTTESDDFTETTSLEVDAQSSKWLFVACYNPPSQNEELFISNLSKTINAFSAACSNIFLMDGFNLTIKNKHLKKLLNLFNL